MDIHELAEFTRTTGELSVTVGGTALTLDLSHYHERLYALNLLTTVPYPQTDIDTMLINRLVRPQDLVLDAGANIGFTALTFAAAGVAKVIAVEPASRLFERLERLSNGRIVTIQAAISGKAGTQELMISKTHNQGSSLKVEIRDMFPQIFGDDPEVETVTVTTIDDLCAAHGRFDIWKLDIEGAEVDALEGAKLTLKKSPPRAIIAELYGPFYAPFADKMRDSHPHTYRALIRREDYGLVLSAPDVEVDDTYHHHSPMYVFSQTPIT